MTEYVSYMKRIPVYFSGGPLNKERHRITLPIPDLVKRPTEDGKYAVYRNEGIGSVDSHGHLEYVYLTYIYTED